MENVFIEANWRFYSCLLLKKRDRQRDRQTPYIAAENVLSAH